MADNAHYSVKLTRREARVIVLRFGLDLAGVDRRSRTLAEVAELLNVSPERVRQIESKAHARLRTGAVADGR